ncbi:MAG: branched-chain amino acid ABC transporter substrate-binding protein [Anaerolineae bacterium]
MPKPTVKLGCSAVLSRDPDEAVHGGHIAQAVRLAVEQANARGDLPCEVEVVVGDDGADVAMSVGVAQSFIADPQVLGVVGTMNSDTSLAVGPLFAAAGLAQIAPAASNPDLTRQGWPTFFRLVATDLVQGAVAARYAVSVLGARAIAVIHDGSSFGKPLGRIFGEAARAQGAEVILFVGIQRGELDFHDLAHRVARAAPDLIFFGVIEAEGRVLARQLREAGVTARYFGADGLKPSRFLATPGWPVDGPYHTNAGTDVFHSPSSACFVADYRARFGEVYSIYTAEAYDAANILLAALARAPRLDRSSVVAEVARTRDFAGATGSITFDERGDLLNPRIGLYRVDGDQTIFLGYASDLLAHPVSSWNLPFEL